MKKVIRATCIFLFFTSPTFCLADEIKLLFPKYEETQASAKGNFGKVTSYKLAKNADDNSTEYVETGLAEFAKSFEDKGYKVKQIELWVSGKAESGSVTKFIISVQGEGGCKIILEP